MPFTVDQLLALATNLDDLAAELSTKASGRCNCENSHCKHCKGEGSCKNQAGDKKAKYVGALCDECAKHMPAQYMLKDAGQTFDEKDKEHKQWEKDHPRMRDWSEKEWSKYLSKDKKDSNKVDYPQPPDFGEDFEKYKRILDPKPDNDEDAYEKWLKDKVPDEKDLVKEIGREFDEEPTASADTYIRTAADKKKLDPKAKVRTRGRCVVPAERALDHADHYPYNTIEEGRAALRYVGKQKSAPWYRGSVESLKKAVERAVHGAFPELKKDKKKSSSVEISETILNKYC